MTEPTSPAPSRRATQSFIFVSVMLELMALGMVAPVLPGLLSSMQDHDIGRAATLFGLFAITWELMQFLLAPFFGVLSDRYGRRSVILLSNFGGAVDYILMALAPTLGWLILGRIISGIAAAGISTTSAYVADVTPPEKRAASFGLLGTAIGIGSVLGPAFGGLLGGVNPRLPFVVAAVLGIINSLYGLFVLPESLPPERRVAFDWKRANPVSALGLLASSPVMLKLTAAQILHNLAQFAVPSIFVLYTSYRYGWSERTIGLALAGMAVCAMAVQGGLMRPLVSRLGERGTMCLGLCFGVAGFALYGLAPNGLVFCLGIPVLGLLGMFMPTAQSVMSNSVSDSEQGQLQGAFGSIMGIGGILGPAIFSQVFAFSINSRHPWQWPGAAFLLATLMLGVALVISWRIQGSPQQAAPPAPAPIAGA